MKSLYIPFILIFSFNNLFSQNNVLNGSIIDSVTKTPIEFVNIGIKEKSVGTISNTEGKFNVKDYMKFLGDSITFSHVGYHSKTILISKNNEITILLKPREQEIAEVFISSKKRKHKRSGVRSYNPLLWGSLINKNQDIIEVSQLIRIGNRQKIHLNNSYIYLRTSLKKESPYIRINFYKATENGPGEKIVFQNFIYKKSLEKGWLKLDLSDQGITIDQDFFISFEFLPTNEKNLTLYSGAKIVKGKGYYRNSSLGDWKKSQGAYSIYVEYEY